MTSVATPIIVFLFADEVRLAAQALAAVRAIDRDDPDQQDALSAAIINALNVCFAALDGAEREDRSLMLTSKATLGAGQ